MRHDLTTALIERQMARILTENPGLMDDEESRLITLESETDGVEALRSLVKDMMVADAFASGLAGMIEDMEARKARFVKRVTTYRALIERIMSAADISKLPLPEATLSLRPSPQRVVIANEAAIPDEYWRTKREPNKTAIKDALRDGVTIPGAFLSNGEPALSVRMT